MKKKILYIEDEPYLSRIVKDTLEIKDYEVLHKKDGSRLVDTLKKFGPDLVLLDVMLPHVDGFTLGSTIRNIYPKLPIIFITAKTQTEDILKGFSSGGTDYMKKPFSMEELMVRIENQLRLMKAEGSEASELPDVIQLKQFRFCPATHELYAPAKTIKLSNRESQILAMLCSYRNRPVDRKTLLRAVWGDDSFFNSRNLDVYIGKLRGYLEDEPGIEIVTLKGIGYRFVVS